jgi:hypothetical protein
LCTKPIDPEPKSLVEEGDREADMIGATHVDARVFRHAKLPAGKGVNRLQRVVAGLPAMSIPCICHLDADRQETTPSCVR